MSSNTKTSGKLSLSNHLLIAMPGLNDPNFHQSVSYICEHNEEGAMGLVINRPLYISFADLFEQLEIEINDLDVADYPIFEGGPVEMEAGFILYTADYHAENQLQVSPTVCLSSDPQILQDIALHNGPENYLFLLGYAGWGPGQLENELTDNGWLILPAEDTIIFNTPDPMKWKVAARKFGIDITTYGDVVGSA